MIVSGINHRRQHGRRHHLFGHGGGSHGGLSARHPVDRRFPGAAQRGSISTPPRGRRRSGRALVGTTPGRRQRCSTSTYRTSRTNNYAGSRITRLGKRHKAEPVVKSRTPRGDTVYWVGAAGGAQDGGRRHGFSCRGARAAFPSRRCRSTLPTIRQIEAAAKGWLK